MPLQKALVAGASADISSEARAIGARAPNTSNEATSNAEFTRHDTLKIRTIAVIATILLFGPSLAENGPLKPFATVLLSIDMNGCGICGKCTTFSPPAGAAC